MRRSQRPSKPVFRGIAKSRKGRPSISLQTIIDRVTKKAMLEELLKWAEEGGTVSAEEALEAAKELSKTPRERAQKHLERGIVPAILAPGIHAAGRATRAAIDAKKGRWGAAAKAMKDTTKGGVAQSALQGGLVGAGLSLSHEGIAVAKAKDTYNDFLKQHGRRKK